MKLTTIIALAALASPASAQMYALTPTSVPPVPVTAPRAPSTLHPSIEDRRTNDTTLWAPADVWTGYCAPQLTLVQCLATRKDR